MTSLRKCPVEGCTRKWLKLGGLGIHLFKDHNKAALVKIALKYVMLTLKNEKWARRVEHHV